MSNFIIYGVLVEFKYQAESHDVEAVTAADYNTCNTLNPLQTYSSGDDIIPLNSPGTSYFICGFPTHCSGAGMLLKVNVLPAGKSSEAPPPKVVNVSPPLSPPPPPPPPIHSPPPPKIFPLSPPPHVPSHKVFKLPHHQ